MPSENANGIATRSPRLTSRTSAPTSSTTPTASWPIGLPVSVLGEVVVGPEVAAADAGADDADDRVGRLLDPWVGDPDVPRRVHDSCSHGCLPPCLTPRKARTAASDRPVVPGTARASRPTGRAYPGAVDTRSEIREFLTSRRAKVTPEQAGLTWYGGTGGFRGSAGRKSLFSPASASTTTPGSSAATWRVSRDRARRARTALQLDEAERVHLYDLARSSQPSARPRRRSTKQTSSQRAVAARLDHRLCGDRRERTPRCPRHQSARARLPRTSSTAPAVPSTSRASSFSTRAPRTFRRLGARRQRRDRLLRWRRAAIRSTERCPISSGSSRRSGDQPPLGDSRRAPSPRARSGQPPPRRRLELSFNRIDVAADPGLMIVTYTAEPGSRSEEALRLLASWTATAADEAASAAREASARLPQSGRSDSPTAPSSDGFTALEDLYLVRRLRR